MLPNEPASPALYQAAYEAAIAYQDGEIGEDGYLATMAAYQRAERERFERVMESVF